MVTGNAKVKNETAYVRHGCKMQEMLQKAKKITYLQVSNNACMFSFICRRKCKECTN